MSATPYRVGIHQFFVLGALVQAPGGALHANDIAAHIKSHRLYFSLNPVLKSLVDRGCIERSAGGMVYRITEYGGEARVSRSRHYFTWFLRLNIKVTVAVLPTSFPEAA